MRKLLLLAIACLFGLTVQSQDFHYSQFYNAPMNLNPALTGIFRGDVRLMANFRNQWASVPVDYLTFTAAADKQFIKRTVNTGFFSGGLAFNYDQAGASKFNLANLNLSGSYTQQLTKHFFGTVGAYLGGAQRGFKMDDLTFNAQYNPYSGQYDSSRSNGENFDQTTNFYMDFGAGINFRLQSYNSEALVDRLTKRSKVDFGLGFFHLNTPNQNFKDAPESPLTMRLSPYALGTIMVGNSLDLIVNFMGQFQKPYTELVGNAGLKIYINRDLGKQFALQLGAGYRFNKEFGDAVYPNIQLFYNGWQAGFSYDVNISDFNVATKSKGGPEFSIRYIITKVRPLPKFKICPLL